MRKLMQYRSLLVLISGSLLCSGCATLIHGTTQDVSISSEPSGADVYEMGNNLGKTPIELQLSRKKKFHSLMLKLDGYKDERVRITRVVSGSVAANILLFPVGALLGWGIDAASGAQWRLVPEEVFVEMKPAQPGEKTETNAEPEEWTVEEQLQDLKGLFDKGLITEDEYKATKKVILEEMTKQ